MVNCHKVALEEERKPQTEKAAFSNVTLLGFKRILVRSDNERTLSSLIERVMSNLTGVEVGTVFVKTRLMKSFFKTTTRAVELWRHRLTRAARGRCVRRWSTSSPPAARGSAR